ncbi:FG-GAP-like repeat-containing protein [Streptomyces viridochromogenes]|uniref:FG-GAP-like repeat-containing protein n=1 Tax=Streptomyces viridochromogenes TaxID=1938 RepID=UPI00065C83EA|nr:FG-GAP-like repeat-containing protein [Streptomyces viridochromogenes]
MGRRALIRGGIAAATSLTLAVGLGPLALDAHADAATEMVIPASTSLTPATDLFSAGPSGFLRREPGRGHVWTTYTGEDTVVDASATEVRGMPEFGAGSDVVARYDDSTRTVKLRDMAAGGTSTTIPLPDGHTYQGTLGRTVVTTGWTDSRLMWHLLELQDDGTVGDRAVPGVPDGVSSNPSVWSGDSPVADAHGMVVQYWIDGKLRSGWLDADKGTLTELPYNPTITTSGRVVLTSTHLVSWDGNNTVSVYSRDDLTKAVRTVPLENDYATHLLGMVGDRILVSRYDSALGAKDGTLPVWRVDALAPDGSTTGTVLARSQSLSYAVPTPDGGLLVPGSGPDTADWGVNLVRAGADGNPVVRKVAASVLGPSADPVRALTLDNGRLTVTEHDRDTGRTHLYSRTIGTAGDTLTVGSRTDHGVSTDPWPHLVGTGDGRTVIWNEWSTQGDHVPRVLRPTGTLPGTAIDSRRKYVRVWDAKGRYAAMATEYTAAAGSETRVVDLDTGGTALTSAQHGRTMWGTTLWVRGDDGVATPVDVRTGTKGESVSFGSKCMLEDLEAVGRWLLWTCAGSGLNESQGVYDTVARTTLTLTQGTWQTAKLGDGFVAMDVDGELRVTDVRGGTPVTHTVGTLSAGQPWDVDPYTGLIAYVDAKQNTHLVPSGVPVSALSQLDSSVAGSVDVKGGAALWSPRWWLSKPTASWTLALKNKATGTTVRTLSGGTAQGVLAPSWNGKDTAGRLVANGAYTWTLTATPADGQGAALTRTGTLKVTGATPVRRDFATADGFGEVLTLNGSGGLTYQYGTGTGTLTAKKTGSGWPTSAKFVPYGDLNGDRCNDVLVRYGSGALRAYRPACGAAVTPSTAYTSLGTSGWTQYDVLTSPGDVSGDGRADLIARQTSTGDVYLYKATSTGKLSARTKIASRWTGYKKIVGAGDLNGDGHGDLLAQDKSNELWRYDGTATGKFKSRVKVFNDWGASYNVVVGVGDITGDGKADVVSRDSAGNLYRNNGNGKGSFGGRTKLATGWQSYKGVF